MCGIAGIIDPNLSKDEIRRNLEMMTQAMVHRGPDDEGFFAAEGVGLGMRRLSIIDLLGGKQPIYNEDASVARSITTVN
jgi:asparagine synthase (glutamine-hydrolysing)